MKYKIHHYIDLFYNKYYLPTVVNRLISKRRNKNKNFTLLTPNCIGGYIYHQLGVPFLSPTINLRIPLPDFYRYIMNLDSYNNLQFSPLPDNGVCPRGLLWDVEVYFSHYRSYEEAITIWKKRSLRIDRDNLYIIATDLDGILEEDIAQLGNLKCKKMVVFTTRNYTFPYCFQVKAKESEGHVIPIRNMIKKTIRGKWKFELFFDYVAWLNSDDTVAEHFRRD